MFKSLFHWKVLLNLVIAIGVFVGLVWLTFRWLEFHTNHGEEIPVPNVVNMTVHQAIKELEDSGLEIEVDSGKYDPKYKSFQVLAIYPSQGSRVKNGSFVTIKVNPRTWAPVAVPDIIDRYKGLAFNQLNLVGLKVSDTIFEPSIQRDAVLRIIYNGSNIKPGTLLPKFSSVGLVIGSGPMRNVAVPNLVGRTVQEAKKIITQHLFEVGIIDSESTGNHDAEIVYYQDPAPGALRDQGNQIDIWSSNRTPAEMINKIRELDIMYRPKIDTVAPAPVYRMEEVQVTETPKPKPAAPVPVTPAPQENKAPSKPSTENKATTTEKPKVKKVVIE